MLGVHDTRRVAWRRQHAQRHYVGYVTVTDDTVRLAGREQATGIDVALSIPHTAVRRVRVAKNGSEEVVGERSVVLELSDDEPIYVRPLDTGSLDLDSFARKLRGPS
jgi:hypothetical protein